MTEKEKLLPADVVKATDKGDDWIELVENAIGEAVPEFKQSPARGDHVDSESGVYFVPQVATGDPHAWISVTISRLVQGEWYMKRPEDCFLVEIRAREDRKRVASCHVSELRIFENAVEFVDVENNVWARISRTGIITPTLMELNLDEN